MSQSVSKSKNTDYTTKYVFCFIIFFVIGIGLGIMGATYFLESKPEEEGEPPAVVINDITNNPEYKTTIDSLYSILNGNPLFYSSTGFDISNLNNSQKLGFTYGYLVNNNTYTTKKLNTTGDDKKYCEFKNNYFLAGSSESCVVSSIPQNDFIVSYKKVFNSDELEINHVGFFIDDSHMCKEEGNNYICGACKSRTGITGSLTAKFNITKVIKADNNDIYIYDRGYLVDTRSNVVRPNSGFDNYYLHTSDSTDYYFELKNADNVTFKHTFRLSGDNSYYYVSSEVVPKEEG